MDDLLNIDDDNIGGVHLLKFAPLWFFSSLSPLTFQAGYSWVNLHCTSETVLFDEEAVDDEHGGHIQISVTGVLPKQRPEVDAILKKYRYHQCLVLGTDQNGYDRLAGKSGGLRLIDTSTTGGQAAESNEYRIQFKGKEREKAEFI